MFRDTVHPWILATKRRTSPGFRCSLRRVWATATSITCGKQGSTPGVAPWVARGQHRTSDPKHHMHIQSIQVLRFLMISNTNDKGPLVFRPTQEARSSQPAHRTTCSQRPFRTERWPTGKPRASSSTRCQQPVPKGRTRIAAPSRSLDLG